MSSLSPQEFCSTPFDYIIIGGGAAGLVLAGRLSEDEDVTVGVLEAGSDQSKNPSVMIPGLALGLSEHPEITIQFKTAPQKGTHDRIHCWPRGMTLGGSAAMNTMMYSNCSKRDLDSWELLGNNGWDWNSMQPYYRKLETYNVPPQDLGKAMGSEYINPNLRGTAGPIQTSFCGSSTGWLEKTWVETCRNAGYPKAQDPRNGINLGAYSQLMCIDPKTKTRSYSYTAYLEPNLGRPNLKILTNAKVGKILLSEEGNEVLATGVRFSVGSEEYDVKARREVLCCAGTIQTPQILELSGIGNRNLLENHGIKVMVDNPAVGENLQDHPLVPVSYQADDDVPASETMRRNPELGALAMEEYTKHGKGPLSGGLTGVGFTSLHMISPELNETQVNELINQAGSFQSTATRKQLEIQEELLRDPNEAVLQYIAVPAGVNLKYIDESFIKAIGHDFPGGWVSLLAVSTHLFSRGSVHINNGDPLAHPVVDPNYMSHPLDAELMARSILHARQLMRTEPFKSKLKKGPDGDLVPPPEHLGPYNDPKTLEEAKEFVKWNCFTCYHPVGTASMQPLKDGGVVDPDLKVYGTKNVRVIDASIFPLHVAGNIMSLVYAIAERGADIVKAARKHTTS